MGNWGSPPSDIDALTPETHRDASLGKAGEKRRRHRVWPWVVGGIGVLLLGVLVAGGVTAKVFLDEAQSARAALESAKNDLKTLAAQLETGDQAAVQVTADRVTKNVADAAAIVDGPLWHLAAQVPFVGQNVDAVQRVTQAVGILVDRALPLGLQFMSTVDLDDVSLAVEGIDLEPYRQVQSSLPEISAAFADAWALVAPVERADLLPEIDDSIAEILTIIRDAAPALDLVDQYLPTLLDMAGSGGTKTYLVIFQNNAEIRATGGNPAASVLVSLTDGKVSYAVQANSYTFYAAGTAGEVQADLPPETTGLYLPTLTSYSQDFTMTPDFPTTAELFRNLWASTTGAHVDGVISIDPVVLAHVLAVTGPVTLATGEQLTADNAVRLLLSEAYERYPTGGESDAFFADVAERVGAQLTTTPWDRMAMLAAIEQAVAEQRIYFSFLDPAAQALAAELGVDGALAPDTTAQTQVGVYLNDSSVGKLEYHLTTTLSAVCDPAARTMTTSMTLYNGITDAVHSDYTLGFRNGGYGIPRTTMMLDVLFFAPPGSQIVQTNPEHGRVPKWDRTGVEKGNSAVSRTVFVPKDETITVSSTIVFPPGDLGPLNLRHTPTANATSVTVDASCDALFGEPHAEPSLLSLLAEQPG